MQQVDRDRSGLALLRAGDGRRDRVDQRVEFGVRGVENRLSLRAVDGDGDDAGRGTASLDEKRAPGFVGSPRPDQQRTNHD